MSTPLPSWLANLLPCLQADGLQELTVIRDLPQRRELHLAVQPPHLVEHIRRTASLDLEEPPCVLVHRAT